MVLCLGEPSRSFLFCCLSLFVDVFHSVVVLPIAIRHHPSPFRWLSPSFYTHFVLLAQSIAEWFATLSFLTIPLSSYRECYGFEWAFFTRRRFIPYTPSRHFHTTCFYQGFTESRQLLFWKLQGFILIPKTQTRLICLFDSQ